MRHAHLYLIAIVLLHIAGTAIHEAYFWLYAPDGQELSQAAWMISPLKYWIPLLPLVCVWCLVDAKDRQIKLPFWVAMVVALTFPIGVPAYYWRTYPRRAAYRQLGLFAAFVCVCLAALWVGRKLTDFYFIWLA